MEKFTNLTVAQAMQRIMNEGYSKTYYQDMIADNRGLENVQGVLE